MHVCNTLSCHLTRCYSIEGAWFQRLKLKCDQLLSCSAFNFNLRRCNLDLSGNEIGPGGGAELAEALPQGTPLLEHLDLRGCFLADPGLTWLAGASTRPLLSSA